MVAENIICIAKYLTLQSEVIRRYSSHCRVFIALRRRSGGRYGDDIRAARGRPVGLHAILGHDPRRPQVLRYIVAGLCHLRSV